MTVLSRQCTLGLHWIHYSVPRSVRGPLEVLKVLQRRCNSSLKGSITSVVKSGGSEHPLPIRVCTVYIGSVCPVYTLATLSLGLGTQTVTPFPRGQWLVVQCLWCREPLIFCFYGEGGEFLYPFQFFLGVGYRTTFDFHESKFSEICHVWQLGTT